MQRLLSTIPRRRAAAFARRLVPHRRRGGRASRRLRRDPRPLQGRDHQRRREHLLGRGRGRAARAIPRCRRSRSSACRTRSGARRRTPSSCCAPARRPARPSCASSRATASPTSRSRKAFHFVDRAAEDRDRQDPEVRAARQARRDLDAVIARCPAVHGAGGQGGGLLPSSPARNASASASVRPRELVS